MPKVTARELRRLIVEKRKQGLTQDEIANHLLTSQPTVSRVLRLHTETGDITPKPIVGKARTAVIQPEDHPVIIDYVLEHPDYTLVEYCEGLTEFLGKTIKSPTHLCELLNSLGLKRKKNTPSDRAVRSAR